MMEEGRHLEKDAYGLTALHQVRRVHARGAVLVAYAEGPEEAVAALRADVRARDLDMHVVPVARMPRLPGGAADEDALQRLPCWVPDDIAALEEKVRERIGCDVAILPEQAPAPQFICVPETHASSETGVADVAETSPQEADEDARPALIERPPLDLGPDDGKPIISILLSAAERGSGGVTTVDGHGEERRFSYRDLLDEARVCAGGLRARGVEPGSLVLFQLPDPHDYLRVFWACQVLGAVPAPLAPAPSFEDGAPGFEALVHTVGLLDGPHVVADAGIADELREALNRRGLAPRSVCKPSELHGAPVQEVAPRGPDDLALVLFTSGSTGQPKAVKLHQDMLMHRAPSLAASAGITDADCILNWLPLDHVGGIVMCHLMPMRVGARQVHAPTGYVSEDMLRWVRLLSRHQASFTWSPNFAYALLLDRADEVRRLKPDLSRLRYALNGGEAVSAKTGVEFAALVTPFGAPAGVILPAWGMSETSSAALWDLAFAAHADASDKTVSMGFPTAGMDVKIVRPDGSTAGMGEVGEILVRGKVVTRGYLNNDAATDEAFDAEGWFRTGDLGRIDARGVTITGRKKDVVIVNGRNVASAEVEAVVDALPEVVTSYTGVAALPSDAKGSEKLAVFFVPALDTDLGVRRALLAIGSAVTNAIGQAPHAIIPLCPEDIPKTSIGKIQRVQLVRRLVDGAFSEQLARADRLYRSPRSLPEWFFRETLEPLERGASTPRNFVIDGGGPLAEGLRTALERGDGGETTIVHVAGSGDLHTELDRLYARIRAMADHGGRLVCILQGADDDPARAALLAVMKSAPQDVPGLDARTIDGDDPSLIPALLRETCAERHLVLRDGKVFARRLLPALPEGKPGILFRPGERYLVTGGLGDAGMVLVGELLRSGAAEVVVTGRRNALDPAVRDKMDKLAAQGGKSVYVEADFADPGDASAAIESAMGGKVDAAFHLAGAYDERSAAQDHRATLERMLTPKVGGMEALRLLIEKGLIGSLVAFSSQIGTFGAPMASAYAAANAYLDADVRRLNNEGQCRAYSLGWSALAGTRLVSHLDGADALGRLGLATINPGDMLASLSIALGERPGVMLVGILPGGPIANANRSACPARSVARVFAEGGPKEASLAEKTCRDIQPTDIFGVTLSYEADWLDVFPRDEAEGVDRARLLKGGESDRPLTPREEDVLAIWAEVLGSSHIAPTDNFFAVGGNSMMAMRLVGRIKESFGVDWSMRDVFISGTVAEQAARLPDPVAHAVTDDGADAGADDGPLPLTPAQQRLWFVHGLADAPQLLNISAVMRFEKGVDQERLGDAIDSLVAGNDGLRVRCPMVDSRPVQEIVRPAEAGIVLRTTEVPDGQAVDDAITADAREPFDLERGPLVRFTLLTEKNGVAHLSIVMHHIITDGVSVQLMFRGLLDALETGRLPDWARADYRKAISSTLSGRSPEADAVEEAYWRRKLDAVGQGFELRTDYPRPAVISHRGRMHRRVLTEAGCDAIRVLTEKLGVSAFNVFLSLYSVVLARVSGESDITIGTVVARRDSLSTERALGFFVNLITLRNNLDPSLPVADAMRMIQRSTLEAAEHAGMSFEEVVSRLNPPQAPNRHPFFQVAFAMHDRSITDSPRADVRLEVMEVDLGAAQYDLHLTVRQRGAGYELTLDYAEALFDEATIDLITEYIEEAALSAARDTAQALRAMGLMAPQRRAALVDAWGQGGREDRQGAATFLDRLTERAAVAPDAHALSGQGGAVTYGELERQTDHLATALAAAGVRRGDRVLLARDRGPDLVIAMIGIMKSGAAYVPVDVHYPEERIKRVAREAKPAAIIAEPSLAGAFSELGLPINPGSAGEAEAPERPHADDPAYLIFTSGSTGTPKGVVVTHANLLNLTYAEAKLCHLNDRTRTLQFSSPGFDASVWEIFPTLANGGTVVTADRYAVMPGVALQSTLRDEKISYLTAPPSVLRMLDPDALPDLQVVVTAGEACPSSLAQKWSGGRRFINAYGPTETTVCATAHVVDPGTAMAAPPIGRPLDNMSVYVLDAEGTLVPQGAVGELCVGGAGVAQGYFNDPERTAAAFVPSPFGPGNLYRTGDLVRWRWDGRLEFVGRADHQVKVRGVRVELAEVEQVLTDHAVVADAVVQVEPSEGGDVLAAYVTLSDGAVPGEAMSALREHLRARLPAAMLPSQLVPIESFAITSSGKIDRASVAERPRLAFEKGTAAVKAEGLEAELAAIWSEVLGQASIDPQANFFDIGGHSLAMTSVHGKLQKHLGRDIPLVLLFQHPTVASLARQLDSKERAPEPKPRAGQGQRAGASRLAQLNQRRGRPAPRS